VRRYVTTGIIVLSAILGIACAWVICTAYPPVRRFAHLVNPWLSTIGFGLGVVAAVIAFCRRRSVHTTAWLVGDRGWRAIRLPIPGQYRAVHRPGAGRRPASRPRLSVVGADADHILHPPPSPLTPIHRGSREAGFSRALDTLWRQNDSTNRRTEG
jgi:hypothetical protein